MGSKLRGLTRLVKDEVKHVEDTTDSARKTATTTTDTLLKVIIKNSLKKA